MHIGEFSAPHRAKFRFPFDPTKVRHFFQIRKDLGNYFSSISLMPVSARFLGINNLPLFAGKGMLLGNKVGLFFRKESLFRGDTHPFSTSKIECNIQYCNIAHIFW